LYERSRRGSIINIAATLFLAGYTPCAPSSSAKADLIAKIKDIALECYDENIRAFTLALGYMSTDGAFGSITLPDEEKQAIESSMKRCGSPREVALIAANGASYDYFSSAAGNKAVTDGSRVRL
jgi:NAD(P)-dependent dehydrogenase (short-subunit alcohol dehydrogenase family)